MRTVRFGIIGCGMMGREFASASARWFHLPQMDVRPEIVAICSRHNVPERTKWFTTNLPTIKQVTTDYLEILANPDLEAVYIAVPHNLHEEFYCAALEAGKHLMGEKPFGINKNANDAILLGVKEHSNCFVRCSSQFVFFPGMQRIGRMIQEEDIGKIIEVNVGFLHSSDLNPDKPINWKRKVEYNGEYGCMGDLGMHACFFPFRAGWIPINVRAILSKIMRERPDGKGGKVPCSTWDNATLLCESEDKASGEIFPMTIKIQRIAPGYKNTWYFEVMGTKLSAKFTTKYPNQIQILKYFGAEQSWEHIDMGHEVAFKSITPEIFEFGFSDSLLQMWAAFLYEFDKGKTFSKFAGCVTPEETAISHRLFTVALKSHESKSTVKV